MCRQACLCVCLFVVEDWSLLSMFFIQVASTEWFLGVQIQKFENPYNIEIIKGKYCCCDFGSCSENIFDLQGNCMTHYCQPYFLIHIRDSSCTSTYSFDKTYRLSGESNSSTLDHFLFSVPFKGMELSNRVSTKSVV